MKIQRTSCADVEANLRNGIHHGDIFIGNNDVYRDGLNDAAAFESIIEIKSPALKRNILGN